MVNHLTRLTKQAAFTLGIFVFLVIGFTALSLFTSSPAARVGTARSLNTIPIHEAELAAGGLVLGVIALAIYGGGGMAVALLLPALVILLDLDHLPAFLGMAQPIRPAHSLVFLAVDAITTAVLLRRLDFGLVVVSAFTSHVGIDTGLIPPLSPFSFEYLQVAPYRTPLLIISTVLAFAIGYAMRKKRERA